MAQCLLRVFSHPRTGVLTRVRVASPPLPTAQLDGTAVFATRGTDRRLCASNLLPDSLILSRGNARALRPFSGHLSEARPLVCGTTLHTTWLGLSL